jgi:hypothetical protein
MKHFFSFFLFCIAATTVEGQLSLQEWTEAFFEASFFSGSHYELKEDTVTLIMPFIGEPGKEPFGWYIKKQERLICNLLDSNQKAKVVFETPEKKVTYVLNCNKYPKATSLDERFKIFKEGMYPIKYMNYDSSSTSCGLYIISTSRERMDKLGSAFWKIMCGFVFRRRVPFTFNVHDCFSGKKTYQKKF